MNPNVQIADQILNAIPKDVLVLAVSKLQPPEKIRELYKRRGHLDFGENYVQEALSKQIELADLPLKWHLIGSLQTNKIKSIVGKFELIHSVDSLKLTEKISQQAHLKNVEQKILLQINIAQEKSKGGFDINDYERDLETILKLPAIRVEGLMTMPPLSDNPEDARAYFRALRQLSEKLQNWRPTARALSMGTSGDYKIALEEGATILRLGSVLFGERAAKT